MTKKITKKQTKAQKERLAKKLFKEEYKLAKTIMFTRDEGKCVFCHTPVSKNHYQTCHIIPKEFRETHNDARNLLLGCFYHHKVGKYSIHNHPFWAVEWIRLNRPEQYEFVMAHLGDINVCSKNKSCVTKTSGGKTNGISKS